MTLSEVIKRLQDIEKEKGGELACILKLGTQDVPAHYPIRKIETRKKFYGLCLHDHCVVIE